MTKVEIRLVAYGLALAAVVALALYIMGLRHQVSSANAAAAAALSQTAVAGGQADLSKDATKIIAGAVQRIEAAGNTHNENSAAILTAPGAAAPADPVLVGRVRVGLCRYDAYRADPACAELRPADSGQLPKAGDGNAAPAG